MDGDKQTDFELLIIERHHTKSLKKIIEIKNKQIAALSDELKLVFDKSIEDCDDYVVINIKDEKRVARIKELENRLVYFKKRYNQLLYNFKINKILKH